MPSERRRSGDLLAAAAALRAESDRLREACHHLRQRIRFANCRIAHLRCKSNNLRTVALFQYYHIAPLLRLKA